MKLIEDEDLYRCTVGRSTLLKVNPTLVWREHDIDEEIYSFRNEIYPRWCSEHPDRVRKTRTDDYYVRGFADNIGEIIEEAERYNWPWEWCIDDISRDGKYFCPIRVIMGDSRIFDISGDEPVQLKVSNPATVKGDGCKKSTRVNDRYRIHNPYYKSTSSINIEEFVANYFRKKPFGDKIEPQAGHVYKFDNKLSCIVNNNFLNVQLSLTYDNNSTQRLFDNGNNRAVMQRESEKIGCEVEATPDIQALLDSVNDDRVNTGVEFSRGEDGLIRNLIIRQSRNIALGALESKNSKGE